MMPDNRKSKRHLIHDLRNLRAGLDSMAFLQTLMDMLPVGVYHRTIDGRYLGCNQAFAQFVGRRKDEIPNLTVHDLYPATTAARLLRMEESPVMPGAVHSYEIPLIRADGQIRTILLLKSVVRNESGDPVELVGAMIDVTERKIVEEALRANEQQLRVISELMTETMFSIEVGSDGALSPGWEMGGFSDLLGPVSPGSNPLETLRTSVHPDDLPLFQRHITRLLSGSDDITEYRLYAPDGNVRWLKAYGRPLRNPDTNRIVRLCCALQDITQQKLAEEAILERERIQREAATRIRAIMDAVPALIWVAEDADCRMIWGNRGANEFVRQNSFQADDPGEESKVTRYPVRTIRNGVELKESEWPIRVSATQGVHIRDFEMDMVFWDGMRKTIFGTTSPLFDSEGRPTGAVGAFMDITERRREEQRRKEFELQLLHTQKLESLGIMAGGIAHDFNNLLMSILGNTGLCLEDIPADSQCAVFLEEIEKAAERASALTGQLLAYSGKGQFTVSRVNLASLVKEMKSFLESFVSKKVNLRQEIDPKLPAIEADVSQMRQVLVNVVLNASEAIGDQDGNITIATGVRYLTKADLQSKHFIEDRSEGDYVFLEVADSGCGMDEETLERIFDPFFTTKFTGRGLGLAAVLGIVRGHGGMITVSSTPGQGTVLRTYFPLVRKADVTRKTGRPKPLQWRGEGTILLVDDEEAVKTVTATMLQRAGFTVLKAGDGQEAIEKFQEHCEKIVCVILDLTMPRMDGRETLRRLREGNPALPILLCSGYDEQQAGMNLSEMAGVAFIQKPFRTHAFMAKLKDLLEKSAKPVNPDS